MQQGFREVIAGEPGAAQRRYRIRNWVIIWRLMALLLIPVIAWANPVQLGSLRRTFLVFSLACVYTGVHGFLLTSMPDHARWLHLADVSVCAVLMIGAGVPEVIFIMTAFTCSVFLAFDSPRLRDWLPEATFLSGAYLLAYNSVGFSPVEILFNKPNEMGMFVLIYFFGVGFMAFSIILDRLSSFELETLLESQRKGYRRRLHDDLGNTLCGLHFKIETLKYLDIEGVRQALGYLADGYKRAVQVLGNILGGMEDSSEDDIDAMLLRIKAKLEQGTDVRVRLTGSAAGLTLAPEIIREAAAIIREAAVNARKHAGVDAIAVTVMRRRRCLRITVADNGRGFDAALLKARQQAGHMGVKGMYERAQLIGANLETNSVPGQGTQVVLDLKIPLRSRFGHYLEQDPRLTGKLFSLLVYLKVPVLLLVLVQIGMLPAVDRYSTACIIIAVSLTVNCFLWVTLRLFLYQWLRHRPWLIALDFIAFTGVYYAGQKYGYALHYFYVVYPETGLMLSGLVLGARRNLYLAMGYSLALILSYYVAPPDPALVSNGQLVVDLAVTIVAVLGIAISCGLAGDFTKRLEREQTQAIKRSLERQRELLTMETHKNLYELIISLGEKMEGLAGGAARQNPGEDEISQVKSLSRELKTRLRTIIRTLEEPATAGQKVSG